MNLNFACINSIEMRGSFLKFKRSQDLNLVTYGSIKVKMKF